MKSKNYLLEMMAAVDADRFLAMTHIFQAGALVPLAPRKGPGYHLTDIPMNRGMMAVVGAWREAGAPDAQLNATMSRLMSLGDIFEVPEYFGDYIRSDDGAGDGIAVADVLLKAAALARLVDVKGCLRFDLADVLAHAQRLDAEKDAAVA
ncbi:hypothetical protein [Janthinobacterium agaricidamnosum]|uniref:Uncharacterized protein n=1 Tax=Janthinobacterium agaricidamnosum NBRC 102515 = DSM 9628 TaxID=1349767 RepID=W0V9W1_9BURK|nr:hypothetical protein [Janthinobacterium agaricidamnosum]CDG84138.1 hypothetical protein GJA_3522 [Janthinobacterium agaricidamnosum NBRC 102515 = DSM 9628]